jgi:hypothetical protein
VLLEAVNQGVGLLLWSQESFGYADSFDEAAGRYRGLRGGQLLSLSAANTTGLVVKPDVAKRQLDAEAAVRQPPPSPGPGKEQVAGGAGEGPPTSKPAKELPTRFHGSVDLNASRAGRDASEIAAEVIAHLVGAAGAEVRVSLEIEATSEGGFPDNVVRTVTENARTLKFRTQGFETE